MKHIIYYHCDPDGHTAGAILARHLIKQGTNYDDIIPIEIDYPEVFPIDQINKEDTVYILDISMKESNIREIFDSILSITKNIFWIDHHVSSVRAIERYPDYNPAKIMSIIRGTVDKSYCGAYLTYNFFPGWQALEQVPFSIFLVDQWDSWKGVTKKIRSFIISFNRAWMTIDIRDQCWDNFITNSYKAQDIIDKMILNGTPLIENEDFMFSQIMKSSFTAEIQGSTFLCVNSPIGNSLLFGDSFYEYDAVLRFYYNRETDKFHGSMYSHMESNVDLGSICEKLNGGGHQHAAGFKLNKEEMFKLIDGRYSNMNKNKNAMVISAFPACGKTTLFNDKEFNNDHHVVLDSDSSEFSWIKDSEGNNTKERNPEFPENYMKHIKANIDKADIIFVSSHKAVRDAMNIANIKFYTVCPYNTIEEFNEWIRRMKDRGNNDGFIKFISDNWDEFLEEISFNYGEGIYYIDKNQCIIDVIGSILQCHIKQS